VREMPARCLENLIAQGEPDCAFRTEVHRHSAVPRCLHAAGRFWAGYVITER
jgi:hypothetical protein